MKETRCEVCEEKAVIRYQTLTGEIIDVCYMNSLSYYRRKKR